MDYEITTGVEIPGCMDQFKDKDQNICTSGGSPSKWFGRGCINCVVTRAARCYLLNLDHFERESTTTGDEVTFYSDGADSGSNTLSFGLVAEGGTNFERCMHGGDLHGQCQVRICAPKFTFEVQGTWKLKFSGGYILDLDSYTEGVTNQLFDSVWNPDGRVCTCEDGDAATLSEGCTGDGDKFCASCDDEGKGVANGCCLTDTPAPWMGTNACADYLPAGGITYSGNGLSSGTNPYCSRTFIKKNGFCQRSCVEGGLPNDHENHNANTKCGWS